MKLQAIRAEFEYWRMSDGETLNDYLDCFFDIVNDLKSLGEEVPEKRIVQKLLMSLIRRYKSIVSIIEETRDLDTIRTKELLASVKVYDKKENLHDDRDKFTGIERAFSTLKIATTMPQGLTRGLKISKNQKCGQYKNGKNWSQNSI